MINHLQKKSFLFFIFLIGKLLWAQIEIPKAPSFIYPLNDYAGVIAKSELAKLNTKLFSYNKETSSEILVVLLPELKGEEVHSLANKWLEKWQIGTKGKDNGIVILMAIKEKKIAIETGYGMEAYLTDALTKRILENHFKPNLAGGNYYMAIDEGTDKIFEVLKDAYKNDQKKENENSYQGILIFGILLLIFLLFMLWGGGGSKGDRNRFRKNIAHMLFQIFLIILSNAGRGRSSSSSRERGFGGGGRSGGGGASSGW